MSIHFEVQLILCGDVTTMRNVNTILKKITAKKSVQNLGVF
jgi:hypothetical protein